MKRIRGGSGLGDSLYLRSVAEYFIRRGEAITVCSDFPCIFIGSGAKVEPFRRNNVDIVAHYPSRNAAPTNQWQDICISAGIREPLEHRFAWTVQRQDRCDEILEWAAGRPIVLIAAAHPPMTRKDAFCTEILPAEDAIACASNALSDCYRIQIGGEAPLYDIPHDIDLTGLGSVADLLDLASLASGMLGQCGYIIPLAEAFDKPLLCVWSANVPTAREQYVRRLTPHKVFSKASSRFVVDDYPIEKIEGAARALCDVR